MGWLGLEGAAVLKPSHTERAPEAELRVKFDNILSTYWSFSSRSVFVPASFSSTASGALGCKSQVTFLHMIGSLSFVVHRCFPLQLSGNFLRVLVMEWTPYILKLKCKVSSKIDII